uniref:DDE Tnp4 domain-containing protein n=1 Tax=Anopheles maculatus TaxID=74869 RepID=A0A182S9P4_9DIPT
METELDQTDRATSDSAMLVVQIVSEYRTMLQQQIVLHLKRQRDCLARMRQRFLSKLAHRLHRNYVLYDRTRRRMLMDVTLINTRGRNTRRRKSIRECAVPVVPPSVSGYEFDETQFEQFRMDQDTFQFLFDKLEPELTPAPGVLLSTRMTQAVAIYVLGSGKGYGSAAAKFGMDSDVVHDCVRMFCRAMMNVFRKQVVAMALDDDSIRQAVKEFEEFVGLPQMFGIVGCLHIPIKPSSKELVKYVNSKGWSSIILQVVVDRNGRFVDVSCEHPGHMNPADMLINSTLYQRMEQLEATTETVANSNVLPFLLGDSKYPLLPWLITPYTTGECMTTPERSFNVYAAKGRSCIDKAFDRLVGRWKVLNRCIDHNEASELIITCCILHNIVEQRESPYLDAWNECHGEEDITPEQPHWECQIVSIDGEETLIFSDSFYSYVSICSSCCTRW